MKIRVYVNNNFNQDEITCEEDVILFYFQSIESYKKFRNNLSLKKQFVGELETEVTLEDILKTSDFSKFKKLFKRVKPIINYNREITSIDIPIIIDLSHVNFTEKMAVLTNPEFNKGNIFFKDEYTTGEYITADEMIEMYQTILKNCETIKENGYSPLESLYYIYTKYKERIYQKERKNEKNAISRSLNQIMRGNNIVCVGYSNYLNVIADILGIPTTAISWIDQNNPGSGHQENLVIVNDPKYNIKGIYAIDITWDSKKNEEDTSYIYNIRHFLMPLEIDKKEKEFGGLILPSDKYYYAILDSFKRLNKLLEYNSPDFVIKREKEILLKRINHVYELLGVKKADANANIENELLKIHLWGNKTISPEILKNIINSVTPESEEDLQKTVESSYHYRLMSAESRLYNAIMGRKRKKR